MTKISRYLLLIILLAGLASCSTYSKQQTGKALYKNDSAESYAKVHNRPPID